MFLYMCLYYFCIRESVDSLYRDGAYAYGDAHMRKSLKKLEKASKLTKYKLERLFMCLTVLLKC